MLAESFLRSRIERIIAGSRLVVALVALLAVWSDPAQPVAAVSPTYALLLGYVGFAMALVLASSRRLVSGRAAMLAHGVDLGVFTFLMVATDGPSSPFFLLFTFSVVSAAFRWRWKGAVGTAAAVLVLFAGVGLAHVQMMPEAALEIDRLLLRCAHVLVVGAMLAVFDYYHERTTAELQRLSSWRADPAARDTDGVLRRWMAHVAAVFGTDRVVLVLDDPEEPWLGAAVWSAGRFGRERLPLEAFDRIVAAPLAEAIFLRETGDTAILLEPSGRLGSWRGAALDPAIERALGLSAVISAPIASGAGRGRMFAADPVHSTAEDLMIAGLIAEQLGAALDRLAAVEATRRAAASEERLRLARDLHDGVLQTLAGTALQLENVARQPGTRAPPVRERIRAIQDWLVGEQREMRAFIHNLRPDTASVATEPRLDTALTRLCQALEKQWGLECRLAVEPPELEAPALLSFQLHQIVREAAANAARHGGATMLKVTLRGRDGALGLAIADNGTGLPVRGRFDERACQEARIGPRSLRERVSGLGGRFALVSSDAGLRLEIELPAKQVEQAA